MKKRVLSLILILLIFLNFVSCVGNEKKPAITTTAETTTAGSTTFPDNTTDGDVTTAQGTTSGTTTPPTDTTAGANGTTMPTSPSQMVYEMPVDWAAATEKDANGWITPCIEQWRLLGFSDLDTAAPNIVSSSISPSDYRSQGLKNNGHAKLPVPYFGVHDNEVAVQNNDSAGNGRGAWYVNWGQRWTTLSFRATENDSGIYSVAHAGRPGAIVFTAPYDGEYIYSETVEQLLFVAGGTVLSFEVTVRKNGEVLAKFVPSSSEKSGTLTGSVSLKAGDILMFAFEQTTNVTFKSTQSEHKSNDPFCFKITDVSVTQANHSCSSESLIKLSGAPFYCSDLDGYYSCECGALYATTDTTTQLVETDHKWKDDTCMNCGHKKVKIIFDTDIGGDIDDAGALALIHRLCDKGEAELLAVTHCFNSPYLAGCIDAINTYYGRKVPIGINYSASQMGASYYDSVLTTKFPNEYPASRYGEENGLYDSVKLIRKLLSEAEENSVTLVVTGKLATMSRLLTSGPDEYSDLSGKELIEKKVARTVLMGGRFFETWPMTVYESGIPTHHVMTWEYNIKGSNSADVATVFDGWPGELVLSSYEIGTYIVSMVGYGERGGDDNPVAHVYKMNGDNGRCSWDLTAVLEAVRPNTYWNLHEYGKISVDSEMVTSWDNNGNFRHTYLLPKVDYNEVLKVINDLIEGK